MAEARATRCFQPSPVDRHLVEQLADTARLTGSARNRQPWRLVAVERGDVTVNLSSLGAYAGHLAGAPVVIVVCSQANDQRLDRPFDLGRLCQTLVLAATETGLATCPATFYPETNQRLAAEAVGLPPSWTSTHALSVGWPAPPPRSAGGRSAVPAGRKPLSEVFTWWSPEPPVPAPTTARDAAARGHRTAERSDPRRQC